MDEMNKNRVLIVDDESTNIIALTRILSAEYTVYAATDGQDAIETAREYLPDVILLDILMPDMDGYEVLSILKNDEKTREIPVIFVTGLGSSDDEERGLDLGAADYIIKPFTPTIVRLRVRNLIKMINLIERIKYLSGSDPLTGIPNRRGFDSRLSFGWEYAKRNKTPLSILMIDIDNFKEYNDTHGHLQGDKALKAAAKAIEGSLKRSVDVVARWGGEEFVALLQDTILSGALSVAERVRKNVEDTVIPCADSKATKITVSIGVNTHMPTQDSTAHEFIDGADQALYTAKRTGKNKVCKCEEASGETGD
jgi:diguanylate cyclase (GGDEF)-like protein